MIAITYFPSLREPCGQRRPCSWGALCRWLSAPVVSADKHDVAGFSIATYAGDRRSKATVAQVFAVGLDFDENVSLSVLEKRFAASLAFVHTTWSSTLAEPRARVFLALSRPVTGPEYERVWSACASVAGLTVDSAARDPSRFWFRPSIAAVGRPFVYWPCVGKPVDVEAALEAFPPPPPPPAPPAPPSGPVGDVEARAAAYVDRCEPAISGSGGHAHTFRVAIKLVKGFALDEATAYRLLARWNLTCSPPWSEFDLRRKVRQAAEHGQMAEGALRDASRRR